MVLNQLSDEEWTSLKLPPPDSAIPRPNVQLPDLVDPLPPVGQLDIPGFRVDNVDEVSVVIESPVRGNVGGVVSSVLDQDVHSRTDPTNSTCHDVCFAGLGGEVICLFSNEANVERSARGGRSIGAEVLSDVDVSQYVYGPPTPSPVQCGSNPFNTIASESRSVYSLGDLEMWDHSPHPKTGSCLGAAQPTPPCSTSQIFTAKLTSDTVVSLPNFYFLENANSESFYISPSNITPSPGSSSYVNHCHGSRLAPRRNSV